MSDQDKTREQLIQEVALLRQQIADLQSVQSRRAQTGRDWESVVDSLPQFVCLLDKNGRVLRASRAIERWNLGRVRDAIGLPVHQIFHPHCVDTSCYLKTFLVQAWEDVRQSRLSELEVLDPLLRSYFRIQVRPVLSPNQSDDGPASFAVMTIDDITDRKQAEQALRESEERYRALFNQAYDAIILKDERGQVIDANPAATHLFGYGRAEMRKIKTAELRLPDSTRQTEASHFETWMRHRSGDSIPVDVTITPLQAGEQTLFLSIIRDMTERQQAVERRATLYHLSQQVGATLDLETLYATIHRAAAQLMPCDGFVVCLSEQEYHPVEAARLINNLQEPSCLDHAFYGQLARYILTAGRPLRTDSLSQKNLAQWGIALNDPPDTAQTAILAVPLRAGNRVIGMLATQNCRPHAYTDEDQELLELLAAQAAIAFENAALFQQVRAARTILEQHTVELEKALAQLQELDQIKTRFMANMSHELRTPLHSIIGFSELIMNGEMGQTNPAQRQALSNILTSGERLLDLINNVLDMSKIQAGRLELEETDLNLQDTIEQLADVMAPRAAEKKLELVFYVSPSVPTRLRGDPLRLFQILVNLINNAIKFTQQGQVVMRVVMLKKNTENVDLLFSVNDTGIGIPADKLDHIFESFIQADESIARRYGGSGLGLSIAKELVEMMGGSIGVESEVGQGSIFFFTLTLKRSPNSEVVEPATNLSGLRVLIVDDNATSRQTIRETLDSFGCRPDIAASGVRGLELLRQAADSAGGTFDLVLLDSHMPDAEGLDVLEIMRQIPALSNLPVILLATMDTVGRITDRRDLGPTAYLLKPIKRSQLLATIMALTRHPADTDQTSAPAARPTSAAADIPPLRLLLVEDNEVNRLLGQMMLKRLGHQVELAGSGQEALDMLKRLPIDLVFMDVQMPDMDGIQATQIIRANPQWNRIPIVALTAYSQAGDRERLMAAGMDDYVNKPARTDSFAAVIQRQMDRRRQPPAPQPEVAEPAAPVIFNRAFALDMVQGDQNMLSDLVEMMKNYATEQVAQMAQAVKAQDVVQVGRLAHSIKGMAANLGAERVRQAAEHLEQLGRSGSLPPMRGDLARLHGELEAFRAETQDMISTAPTER